MAKYFRLEASGKGGSMGVIGPEQTVVITELVPIGKHLKNSSDDELIYDISMFEARKEFCKWSINEATIAYYDALKLEWKNRHEGKHIPRMVFTRDKILSKFCDDLYWGD